MGGVHFQFVAVYWWFLGFSDGAVVKNPPAHAGDVRDARDVGLITGLGRSSGVGSDDHSSTLTWKIPWSGEPGGPS